MTAARRRISVATLVLALIATVAAEAAATGNSGATITASFGDSCTGFEARSSKDVSHVEIHYADGRAVKDEAIDDPYFSLDADVEIDFAIVKSGTTAQRFDCDSAPVAACSDGVDNDGNGFADYPGDPGCASAGDDEELSDNGDGFD